MSNVVRRTISLSLRADKILQAMAKSGIKISTVIENLLIKSGDGK